MAIEIRQRRLVFAMLFTATVTACTLAPPVTTKRFVDDAAKPIAGLVYHLPLSILRVKVADGKATLEQVTQVPDPRSRFILQAGYSAAFADSPEFSATNGLLQSINSVSEDRTPLIVTSFTASIDKILRNEDRRATEMEQDAEIKNFDISFAPFSRTSRTVNDLQIKVHPLDPTLRARLSQGQNRNLDCAPDASLCVPVLTLVKVHIQRDSKTLIDAVVPVVDPTRAYGIKLDRNACVTTSNVITLTDGIVTKYDVTKPSQLEGCLSIPLDIVATIIAAPINAILGQTSRRANETMLLKAQLDFLNAQNALLAAQLAQSQPTGSTPQ